MPFIETGKTIQSVDLDTLISWDPCYSESNILRISGGRKSLSAEEVNQLGIPADDRYWVLGRMLSDYQRHILACEIAESVLTEDSDPRSLAAPAAKRAWLRGEISDEELKVAYYAAADYAGYTRSAAADSAYYSASPYYYYAACSACSAARSARSAAYEEFCKMALAKTEEDN